MPRAQKTSRLYGLVLVVVGIGLAIWGYQESQGVVSQVSGALTGAESDSVMFKYIGGAVAVVVGGFLAFK